MNVPMLEGDAFVLEGIAISFVVLQDNFEVLKNVFSIINFPLCTKVAKKC